MRRAFIVLALALTIVPFIAAAQETTRVPVVGYLDAAAVPSPLSDAFIRGMRELGYIDGTNVKFEMRGADARLERLPALAAELVERRVDVIVATVTSATQAAKGATRSIPIVMVRTSDPVGVGLVGSLAQPGGNVTGLSEASAEVSGKRLEVLREVLPRMSRIGIVWNPDATGPANTFKHLQAAAATLGLTVTSLPVRKPDELDPAFRNASERSDGVAVVEDLIVATHLDRVVEAAAKYGVPTIHPNAILTRSGGLISYATDTSDLYRRAGVHVDKILRGAKPADLPVQLPTKFELVVNLKTAKALGLTIPQSVLLRADEVIE